MTTPVITGPNNLTGTKLRIIRYAMLTMLLLFGGIAYWQSTHRTEPLDPETQLDALRWAGLGLCAAAIVGMGVIRGIRARAQGPLRLTWSLIGSALAEGAALFGAVFMILGGEPWIYLLGVLIFLATWSMLPADPDAA